MLDHKQKIIWQANRATDGQKVIYTRSDYDGLTKVGRHGVEQQSRGDEEETKGLFKAQIVDSVWRELRSLNTPTIIKFLTNPY